ncbi:hypothetical protein CHS0354_015104 [Potamilus streckersoni]|uniref:Uncharacterized protein n=1 Tax=Potamilus streckersoni TaxID=2493646 RepID=A0AAE0TK06_9BIVA|nr:hypothetical protein CHS0354_015104 [Potamilus streckersoni]
MASDIMSQDVPPPLPSRNPPRNKTVSNEHPHRPLPDVPNNATLPSRKNSNSAQFSTDTYPRRSQQMSVDSSSTSYTNVTPHVGSSTVQSSEAPPPLPQRNNLTRSASSAKKSFRHPQVSSVATSHSHLVQESNVREAPPPPSLATLPRRKDQDEMETRFRFHSLEDFPKPDPMKEAMKTYPSHKVSNGSSSAKDAKSRRPPKQPLPAL